MAKIVMEEQPDFDVLPQDSILDLKIDEVEVRDVEYNGRSWQSVDFKFKILGVQATGDGSAPSNFDGMIGGTIFGSCSAKLTDNPENKLRQWCEAIFQMPLEVGFELDTDLLVGRQVRGVTTAYKNKSGFDRAKVDSLLPKAGSGAGPATTPKAATQGSKPAPAAAGSWGDWGKGQSEDPPF